MPRKETLEGIQHKLSQVEDLYMSAMAQPSQKTIEELVVVMEEIAADINMMWPVAPLLNKQLITPATKRVRPNLKKM